MLKHFAIALICFVFISCVLTAPRFSASDPDITVTLDGAILSFDVPPQIINERTMIPMRAIFEALGANIEWDDETQTITALRYHIYTTYNNKRIKTFLPSVQIFHSIWTLSLVARICDISPSITSRLPSKSVLSQLSR